MESLKQGEVASERVRPAWPGMGWLLRMAWRDSRGKRGLLALFMLSVVFGIGAIVAILSLRLNLLSIVDEQAKTLLGADLILDTRVEPGVAFERFMEDLGGRRTREVRLRSMMQFPDSGAAQFVQLRAIEGTFPFYGSAETEPAVEDPLGRLARWQVGEVPGLLSGEAAVAPPVWVEEALMRQQQLAPGDTVVIGDKTFAVAGALLRISGESEVTGFFAPRVFMPLSALAQTGLLQTGSMVRHRNYFAFADGLTPAIEDKLARAQAGLFVDAGVRMETVADRRQSLERILGNLFDFLNLIGFTALLLGGIGIGGAVQVYLQAKLNTIAVLRCLGTPVWVAFAIYLLQISVFGLLGALLGTLVGVATQFVLPLLLQSFLPFEVEIFLAPSAIFAGLVFGWLTATLFGLLPLLTIRAITPLSALRSVVASRNAWRDPLRWLVVVTLAGSLLAFLLLNAGDMRFALAFLGGLAAALAGLWLLAGTLRWALRKFVPAGAPYSLRIAMGNLYRPNNRTLLMLVTIGMGVMLLNTLFLARLALLEQVRVDGPGDAPNVILLDVQPDQLEAVKAMLQQRGQPAVDVMPVVTMRVAAIHGRPMREWRNDPDSPVSDWVFTWEFRNTYRDHILDNAELIAGEFIPHYDGPEPFPISLSENVLDDLGVQVGDALTWDVQGIPVETVVASVRRVRWQAGRQNFNVVFPLGTIEAAPTVYAMSVRSPDRAETAALQAELTGRFGNVSLIDLSLVFETVSDLLSRAAFVIQFMAAFTIATGIIVLAGAVLSSRYQRIGESVLFRTMGATRRFIQAVLAYEFLALGALAVAAGLLLSMAANWALLHFAFDLPLRVDFAGSLTLGAGVLLLTLATGWFTSRGIATAPPLTILRKEG